jgi:hypothetical protein
MIVYQLLKLLEGVPDNTLVLLDDGDDVVGITYDAEGGYIYIEGGPDNTFSEEAEWPDDMSDDYFTDEGKDIA